MKKYVIITLAVLGMASCSEKKFHVEGTITEAQDSVLYLENVGINEINAIDSVKLSADGQFSFSGEATEAPEFYRLRIADQIINVAIDSTETVQKIVRKSRSLLLNRWTFSVVPSLSAAMSI